VGGGGGGGRGHGINYGAKSLYRGPGIGAWLLERFSLREIQILKKPKLVQVPTV
jgi:hypothetical protein